MAAVWRWWLRRWWRRRWCWCCLLLRVGVVRGEVGAYLEPISGYLRTIFGLSPKSRKASRSKGFSQLPPTPVTISGLSKEYIRATSGLSQEPENPAARAPAIISGDFGGAQKSSPTGEVGTLLLGRCLLKPLARALTSTCCLLSHSISPESGTRYMITCRSATHGWHGKLNSSRAMLLWGSGLEDHAHPNCR